MLRRASDRLRRKCAQCEDEDHALRRRSTGVAGGASSDIYAPQSVDRVLHSTGRPLDRSVRDYMEPRFGRDFSGVRIHTGSSAARSAEDIGALAYTVGESIVFGAGQYATHSPRGLTLLAHELAHVVQQGPRSAPFGSPIAIGSSGDASEKAADAVAASVMSERPVQAGPESAPARLQRQPRTAREGSAAPTGGSAGSTGSTGAATSPPPSVCGPDVTSQVSDVLTAMSSDWAGWNANQRDEACWALENISCGPSAWDIVDLHNNAWIYQNYRPACATQGATPPCGSTVQIGSGCHFAGAANYVIFGRQCALCDIWRWTMHMAVRAHKIHLRGYDKDIDAAMAWADAGFDGWPGSATPAGDRNSCSPTCATPYAGAAFDYHWYPPHKTETVDSDCPAALDEHKFMRDNPPDYTPFGP